MTTRDFFRARLEQMIDLRHPLAVLARRMPWGQIEAALAPAFARKDRPGQVMTGSDLFGPTLEIAGAGVSAAGRPRLSIRLMASLLYLKHAFNLSDEDVAARWAENVVWQYFSGQEYYEPRLPCDATQIGRFRAAIGEAGVEELLKATIDTAVQAKAVRPAEFERIIVDTTVQEKAIAHPVDARLLEIARAKVVQAAKRVGIALKQTFVKEGKELRRKSGGYAHAKQFKRLRRTVKRQRTILGIVLREIRRKLPAASPESPLAVTRLNTLLERAEKIRTQQPKDKNKLYALHAPEVECIGKGKARKPYEFGVKASIAVTYRSGLMVGARTFPGNPYDGHLLNAQLEQTGILLEDTGKTPKEVVVDLGFRGVDRDNPGVEIIHRGKYRSLTSRQRRWLKRRQAVEPAIGHLKSDHRMDRCWLQGQLGDALHAVLCAAGYNLRWLLRAMVRLGLTAHLLRPLLLALIAIFHGGRLPHASPLSLGGTGDGGRGAGDGSWRQMNFAGPTIPCPTQRRSPQRAARSRVASRRRILRRRNHESERTARSCSRRARAGLRAVFALPRRRGRDHARRPRVPRLQCRKRLLRPDHLRRTHRPVRRHRRRCQTGRVRTTGGDCRHSATDRAVWRVPPSDDRTGWAATAGTACQPARSAACDHGRCAIAGSVHTGSAARVKSMRRGGCRSMVVKKALR